MTGYDDHITCSVHKVKNKKSRHLEKEIKIGTIGKGQIVGHIDVFNETDHTTSVKCISGHGVVY
jgi:hypothetical protein